jgi:hypothetical protein
MAVWNRGSVGVCCLVLWLAGCGQGGKGARGGQGDSGSAVTSATTPSATSPTVSTTPSPSSSPTTTSSPGHTGDTAALSTTGPAYPLDGVLTLSNVQAKGTHNSYHQEPDFPVHPTHRYSHSPLAEQLEDQGVRQFELDLHYRTGLGFEVFHLPLIDQDTSCLRLVDCLVEVAEWSDAHPQHVPLMVWFEPKDEDMDWAVGDLEDIRDHYDELESDVLAALGRDRIVAPDDVRGAHATLPEAIAAQGWPTLGELRGRVLISLLDSGSNRDAYVGEATNLEGRLFFVDSDDPADPFAAMFKINNAHEESVRVSELVADGFIVTTNADDLQASDDDNLQRALGSLEAGAHYLSTDQPVPDGGYWFDIQDGSPARCNPVRAAVGCGPDDIEAL